MVSTDAINEAIVMGCISFAAVLVAGLVTRDRMSALARVRDALFWGAVFGLSALAGAMIDLPVLEPPVSTVLVAGACVAAVAVSVYFFRAMLRDGSAED